MEFIETFVLGDKSHNITVLWRENEPWFRATEVAKVLEIKTVRTTLQSFDDDEKGVQIVNTPGGPQSILFLTEDGLYHLLWVSKKPCAKAFRKWVCQVIKTIRRTGQYRLEAYAQENAELKEELVRKTAILDAISIEAEIYKARAATSVHYALIDAYANKHTVYFARIRQTADGTLVKIGSTKDIKTRVQQLIRDFGSAELFKMFECDMDEDFERFLQHHKSMVPLRFKDEVYNGLKSNEVFLLTEVQISTLVNVATANVHRFRRISEIELYLRLNEQQKELMDRFEATTHALQQQNDVPPIPAPEIIPIDPSILAGEHRKFTHAKGFKIQRYSPDGQTLLQTYPSLMLVIRDENLDAPTYSRVKDAISSKIVYKGFRWAYLERAQPDDTIQQLEPTVERDKREPNKGCLAALDLEKKKIMEVYSDQIAAAEALKLRNTSISCSMRRGSITRGRYFINWSSTTEEQKLAWLAAGNVLPEPRITGKMRPIERVHPITLSVIKKYACVSEVIKEFSFSRASLYNAIDNNLISKGCRWRYAAAAHEEDQQPVV